LPQSINVGGKQAAGEATEEAGGGASVVEQREELEDEDEWIVQKVRATIMTSPLDSGFLMT
jgi:hypothetical protein